MSSLTPVGKFALASAQIYRGVSAPVGHGAVQATCGWPNAGGTLRGHGPPVAIRTSRPAPRVVYRGHRFTLSSAWNATLSAWAHSLLGASAYAPSDGSLPPATAGVRAGSTGGGSPQIRVHAGRCVRVVSERNTTRACSNCGSGRGPSGLDGLLVRPWLCGECGVTHDRDVNAARNILAAGRCCPSVFFAFSPAAEPGITSMRGKDQRAVGGGMNTRAHGEAFDH